MNSQDPTATPTTQNDPFDVFGGGLHNMPITYEVPLIPHGIINKDHPLDIIIGNINTPVRTRKQLQELDHHGFVS